MKAHLNKQTKEEIDAVVTALADDDNAWDLDYGCPQNIQECLQE